MTLTRSIRTLTVAGLAAFAMVAGSGCFGAKPGDEHEVIREGIAVDIGGLDYNVYMTRQINPRDAEDSAYYNGSEESEECAGTTLTDAERVQRCPTNLWGVFIAVCNLNDGEPREPARAQPSDFEIEDSQGNKFEPIELPATNLFAYRPRPLGKADCIPEAGSAASTAPIAGSVLVFRLPVATTENRPLELTITKGADKRHFELDL